MASTIIPSLSAACEAGFCWRCRGQVISLLAPAGQLCSHDCHGANDEEAIERRLEAEHFGEVA